MTQLEAGPGAQLRDALGTDLGWLLGQTLRGYTQLADRAGADLPGGMRGYLVLTAASRGCVTTQLSLARQLGLDRTVMTHLIDELEAAGLIERVAAAHDRRAKNVTVTEPGRAEWERVNGLLQRAEDHLLAALAPDERASFRGHLRQLACQVRPAPEVGEMCKIAEDVRTGGAR
jgi:DNA-binding MarR family transcriptional regulator